MRKTINLYLVFGAGYLAFLFVVFVRIAMKSEIGFSPQAVGVFAAIFLPPAVFAYLAGFKNGREILANTEALANALEEKDEKERT